jgi:tetratricopeptide (TPR) repeat protein
MFKIIGRIIKNRETYLLLVSIVTLIFLSLPILAQEGIELGRTFNRGRNTIEGRIYYPSGIPADKRFKITLQSVNVNEMFTFSDEQGVFVFRRLPSGTYRIAIDAGKEYEIYYETVDIIEPARRQGDQSEITRKITAFLKLKGRVSAPTDTVNAALAGTPKPALELYEKAQQAVKGGDKQKAIEFLEQAVKKHPQFAEAYKELGVLYMMTNNLDKAVDAFHEAVKILPDNFTYRLNLGYALLQNNKAKDAKEELLKATAINDKSVMAFIQLGKAQIMLKEYNDAEKTLLQSINLGGSDVVMAYRFLGVLYNDKGDMARAAGAFEKYLSMSPNTKDADALIKLGRAQIKLQLLNEAEKSLQQAVNIGGAEATIAYKFLGAVYNEKGDAARAIQSLEKYLSLAPNAKDAEQVRKVIEDLRRQKN